MEVIIPEETKKEILSRTIKTCKPETEMKLMSPHEYKQFEKINLLLTEKTQSLCNKKRENKSNTDNFKNKFTMLSPESEKMSNSAKYKDMKKTKFIKNESQIQERDGLILAFENELNLTKSKTYFGFSEKVLKYYESQSLIKSNLIKAKIGNIIEELSHNEKNTVKAIDNIKDKESESEKAVLLSRMLNLNQNISNNNTLQELSGQNLNKDEKKEGSKKDLLQVSSLPVISQNEAIKNELQSAKKENKNESKIIQSEEQDLGETRKNINESTVVNTLPSFSSYRKGNGKKKLINIFKDEIDDILSLVEDLKRSKFITANSKRK